MRVRQWSRKSGSTITSVPPISLREKLGENLSVLLLAALQSSAKRVVVKRAANAGYLGDIKPDLELSGSQARFDIYLLKPAKA